MKKIFQLWLFLFVTAAFLSTLVVSWNIETYAVRKNARQLLTVNIEDAKVRLDKSRSNLEDFISVYKESLVSTARAWAKIVEQDPTIIEDYDRVVEIAKELNAEELIVTDEKGIIIAAFPDSYLGFDMNSTDQSRAFMPAIEDPKFELAQEPRPNGSKGEYRQYGGVARRDKPGIVQVAISPRHLGKMVALAELSNIYSAISIGREGGMIIFKNISGANLYGYDEGGKYFRDELVDGVPSIVLSALYKEYVIMAYIPCEEVYAERAQTMRFITWISLALFLVIFFLISALVQQLVVNGIYSVNDSLNKITKGDLNEQVEVSTAPEFVVLSNGVNQTVGALKKAIEKEAKRIDDELLLCQRIQRQFLPTDFPDESRFLFTGDLITAREVGGDFYDFFYLDEDRFVFLIADVSGKGLTAALFMTTAKAYLRKAILDGLDFADAIASANAELVKGNTTNMFLTGFFCLFNGKTNELTCVNAGHNPPLMRRAGGQWEYLAIEPSLIIGIMADAPYDGVTMKLEPGDALYLYTDGVSEAMNDKGEPYGEKRLQDALNAYDGEPEKTIEYLQKTLRKYRNGAPKSDDVTMLYMLKH